MGKPFVVRKCTQTDEENQGFHIQIAGCFWQAGWLKYHPGINRRSIAHTPAPDSSEGKEMNNVVFPYADLSRRSSFSLLQPFVFQSACCRSIGRSDKCPS
jgi:hypothetical protein